MGDKGQEHELAPVSAENPDNLKRNTTVFRPGIASLHDGYDELFKYSVKEKYKDLFNSHKVEVKKAVDVVYLYIFKRSCSHTIIGQMKKVLEYDESDFEKHG